MRGRAAAHRGWSQEGMVVGTASPGVAGPGGPWNEARMCPEINR